jgi:hypothetical protein
VSAVERTSGTDLTGAVDELWIAVGELVIVLAEDQPQDPDGLAVADDLLEAASEIQGVLHDLRSHPGNTGPAGTLALLEGLLDLERRFAERFTAADAVGRLRSSTRRRAGQWPVWRRSVEAGAQRVQDASRLASGQALTELRGLALDLRRGTT